jgi:hypothetical protein
MASLLLSRQITKLDVETDIPSSSNWNSPPSCIRCGGLMVDHVCMDLSNTGHELEFTALRCIQCGDIVDPVILHHRQRRQNRQAIELCQTAPPFADQKVAV